MNTETTMLHRFAATVNGNAVSFTDPQPTAGQILAEANCLPPSDFALIQLLKHGTRLIGLDDTVDLREQEKAAFRAFETDRIYDFTVDERGYVWGTDLIPEPELREITCIDEDKVFVLERDGKDKELGPDESLDLGKKGTEHLRTIKGFVDVVLDDDIHKRIPRGIYTTEQLIAALGVEPGYRLNVLVDGELKLLEPGEKLRVKEGMHFFSQQPGGGSS